MVFTAVTRDTTEVALLGQNRFRMTRLLNPPYPKNGRNDAIIDERYDRGIKVYFILAKMVFE